MPRREDVEPALQERSRTAEIPIPENLTETPSWSMPKAGLPGVVTCVPWASEMTIDLAGGAQRVMPSRKAIRTGGRPAPVG